MIKLIKHVNIYNIQIFHLCVILLKLIQIFQQLLTITILGVVEEAIILEFERLIYLLVT